jgi:LCP family protein required for cell wall assembly
MAVPDQRPPRLALGLYKRMLVAALVIVASTAGAVSTAALLQVKQAANIFDEFSVPIAGIDKKGVLDGVSAGGPQTILVLGSDRRFVDIKAKNPVRSDTMLLIRLDPSRGATAVLSIPRDLKVDIPGRGSDKINAAYALGGPELAVRTVRQLLGTPINHVVNVNFGGFQRAVNRLGCVYADIDRRYFNDNNPPAGGGSDYAVIDVAAGYQKLCGEDALNYVRYRHFDSDLVRAARQQDFVRQAKDQIGVGRIFSDRTELLKIFARYTQTDIRGESAILRLLKLTVESAKNPIQEVRFPAQEEGDHLTVTPEGLARIKDLFLNAKGSSRPRSAAKKTAGDRNLERRQSRRRRTGIPVGLFDARTAGEDNAIRLGARVRFPVYYPRYAALGSRYDTTDQRAYTITDRGNHRYDAYRMVISAPGVGQYYGVQGTTWKAPPILDNASEQRRIGGRKFRLYFDGSRLRMVAWQTDRAVYWISNTLLQSLTNKQMLGLAESLTRVGS